MIATVTTQTWTKELIQEHAQVAVAVELYTLPFYLTALTSIKDSKDPIYKAILSVCIEEMLHLELAANLCLALDTKPHFTIPQYGTILKYLKPDDPLTKHYKLLRAKLGPLNEKTLQTMLDIETPTELETAPGDLSQRPTTPNYPYNTLGEMYDALLYGIEMIGANKFKWDTSKQQMLFTTASSNYQDSSTTISQKISNLLEAQDAIGLINAQGEGSTSTTKLTPPYKEADFSVPTKYQISGDADDPNSLGQYSHFGRFLWIYNQIHNNNNGVYPETYPIHRPNERAAIKQAAYNNILMVNFANLIDDMNKAWNTGEGDIFSNMTVLIDNATNCWKNGAIPMWSL